MNTEGNILLVNKPEKESSYDQIRKLKKIFQFKKIGHTGTLDPFATGLLIVLIGPTVKLQKYFLNLEKTYLTTLKFGYETNTLDLTGKIVFQSNQLVKLSLKALSQFLKIHFLKKIEQIPPQFSAIKFKGKRAYKLARKGQGMNLPTRIVKIKKIKLIKWQEKKQELVLEIICSSGTYIRSLVRDIGRKLNNFATTLKLTRTQIGDFNLKRAYSITSSTNITQLEKKTLSWEKIIPHHPIALTFNPKEFNLIKNGDILFLKNKVKLGYNFIYLKKKLILIIEKNKIKTKILFNQALNGNQVL